MYDEFSIPAHHLLKCLCAIGPIPIPLFLIEELDNIITKAEINNGAQTIMRDHACMCSNIVTQNIRT